MSALMNTISVIIVEDHSIFIEGLCGVLQEVENLRVDATFTDGQAALEYLQENSVGLVLLDISLPGMSGTEVCRAIKKIDSNIRVIALTNHTEKSVILQMLQNGADGYLLKNTTRDELITAVSQVLNNRFQLHTDIQKLLFAPIVKNTAAVPRLTQREKEVLVLVSEGVTTAGIADRLFISRQTVETHRHHLMQKFGVNNSAALIKKAGEYGLI